MAQVVMIINHYMLILEFQDTLLERSGKGERDKKTPSEAPKEENAVKKAFFIHLSYPFHRFHFCEPLFFFLSL